MSKLPIPFGNPHTYPGHSGVDFPGHAGEPIRASGPGRITTRGSNRRGGFYVWVQYDNGTRVGYHHMNSHAGTPAAGSRVAEGSVLGYVGWAGNVRPAGRAGAHLHSEVYGHATTSGYWRHFDRGRVVGQPAPSGGSNNDLPPIPIIQRKEPDMATGVIYTDDSADKSRSGAIVNTESGLFSAFGWFTKSYANDLAKGFGLSQAGQVTRGQYDQIRKDMAALRALRTAEGC